MNNPYYITPIPNTEKPLSWDGVDTIYILCNVEDVLTHVKTQDYYQKALFEKDFHGTVTMFDYHTISEIATNYDVRFEYITSLNPETGMMSASDGVIYNLHDNYFCKYNRQTEANLRDALLSCSDFYMQLIIENRTGNIWDITLITNVTKNRDFAYRHRVVKGFLPVDYSAFRQVMEQKRQFTTDNGEKLSQDDIDKLIETTLVKAL